jgi:hypothetical protein
MRHRRPRRACHRRRTPRTRPAGRACPPLSHTRGAPPSHTREFDQRAARDHRSRRPPHAASSTAAPRARTTTTTGHIGAPSRPPTASSTGAPCARTTTTTAATLTLRRRRLERRREARGRTASPNVGSAASVASSSTMSSSSTTATCFACSARTWRTTTTIAPISVSPKPRLPTVRRRCSPVALRSSPCRGSVVSITATSGALPRSARAWPSALVYLTGDPLGCAVVGAHAETTHSNFAVPDKRCVDRPS